jgi:hypothetical protein
VSSTNFAEGDRVVFAPEWARPTDRGVIYTVTKALPANLIVTPIGGGRPVKANRSMFAPAPPADTPSDATSVDLVSAPEPPLWQGTIVTVAGPAWKQPPGQLYIVLRESGDNVSLTKLGGDNGRYWRGVHRKYLTIVDPTHLTYTPPPGPTPGT